MRVLECDDVLEQYADPILIQKGGQRTVYKIHHPDHGDIALKIGNYKTPTDPDGWDIERIEREIEILRSIDSKYYPKNYHFEKISGDRYVILEEFIESKPLSACMERFHESIKVLSLSQHLVLGLKIIWKNNIVHRDLKPDNILISSENNPIIIDLGIARCLDSRSITGNLVAGPLSPDYAAPELQIYHKKAIDFRTDQFSLGIIFAQLLMEGIHPFDPRFVGGDSIYHNIIEDNWNREYFDDGDHQELKPFVEKLLGHSPYQRYKTYQSIEDAIGEYLECCT